MSSMTIRQRAGDMGSADARRIAIAIGREVADTRRAAGVSQRSIAVRAGISRSQLGRLERGELRRPSLEVVCRVARAAGLAPAMKLYPSGARLRDSASQALLARFGAILGAPLRMRREVPVPIAGDLRAWDARITDGSRSASVEGESRIGDAQALERRIELKLRDDPEAGVVILLLNRTAHNRRILAEHREGLRAQFPLDGSAILRALRQGKVPSASGVLML